MTFTEFAQTIPPTRLRLLARTGHGVGVRPKSYSEIARDSGLARSTVIKLLTSDSWGNVGIETLDALTRGCGVNHWRTEHHRKLVRRGKFKHLDNANLPQRRMFARILAGRQSSGTARETNDPCGCVLRSGAPAGDFRGC